MLKSYEHRAIRRLLSGQSSELTPDDAIIRVETAITEVKQRIADKEATLAPHDPHVRQDRFARRREQNIRDDIGALRSGVAKETPVSDPSLCKLIGQPGLDELERTAAKLRELRAAAVGKPTLTWPREFRLKTGKHNLPDGRYLLPGETILLNEAQAQAFADKFEDVALETVGG